MYRWLDLRAADTDKCFAPPNFFTIYGPIYESASNFLAICS